MCRIFILLMIALLPLRSWAGDWMAVSMSTEVLQGVAVTAVAIPLVTARHLPLVDAQDCAGHSGSQSNSAEFATVDNGHCKTCVSCQICHSVALVEIVLLATGAPEVHHLIAASASPFASASLADTIKPPIS